MSFDEHDDSPTDEDKPVSPKKSILSKAAFKRFLVRAGIKWRHGKDKKDKKDENKGKSLVKKEKKTAQEETRHQSGRDAEFGDNEDPKSTSKEKTEQMGKGGLSRKSKLKASVRNSHDQEHDKEREPETRRKATRSLSSPAPLISPDADMNDPVNEADNLSIHSGPADEKPTKPEKSSPKEYSNENIEREKKRLSLLSTTVETVMDEDLVTNSPPPSVKDIDMYVDDDYQFQADGAEKDTDIVSISSESMDLDDDRTLRDEEGGEIYAEAKDSASLPGLRRVVRTGLIGVKRTPNPHPKRTRPTMLRRKSQKARVAMMTPASPQSPKKASPPSPNATALKRRRDQVRVKVKVKMLEAKRMVRCFPQFEV
jgi:hypothetical protein